MSRCTTGNQKTHSKNYGSFFFVFFTYPVSSHGPSLSGYLLCRLPEVSGVRQPAVQLGQLLQHVGQLGEGRPLSQVVRPAGREDLLRTQTNLESMYSAHDISAPLLEQWVDRLQNEHALFNWTTDTLALLSQLTVTSLPRLISAKTFFMPSPLPTCQMVASTCWLVIGQSLAWSSYQMVLKKRGGGGAKVGLLCQTVK